MTEKMPLVLDDAEAEQIKAIVDRVDARAERMALKDAETLDAIGEKMLEEDRSTDEKIYLHFKGDRVMTDRHNRRMKNVENTVATAGAIHVIALRELRQLQSTVNVSFSTQRSTPVHLTCNLLFRLSSSKSAPPWPCRREQTRAACPSPRGSSRTTPPRTGWPRPSST